jgi:hypothetical protein
VDATVERAGFCLEGDQCVRWRCSACGQYWLDDPLAHVCTMPTVFEDTICARVDQELERTADLANSTRTVLRRLRDDGFGHTLLDVFGERLIASLWRARHPAPALTSPVPFAVPPSRSQAMSPPLKATTHRSKRLQLDLLQSSDALLEALVKVDGRWLRLGDLDQRQCRRLASEAHVRARFFERVGDALEPGETVRERWSVAELTGLVRSELFAAAIESAPALAPVAVHVLERHTLGAAAVPA